MEQFEEDAAPQLDSSTVRSEQSFLRSRKLQLAGSFLSLSVVAGCTANASEISSSPSEHPAATQGTEPQSIAPTPTVKASPAASPSTYYFSPSPKAQESQKTAASQSPTASSEASPTNPEQKKHANVVFVLLDDAQLQLMPYMQKTQKLIFDKGAVFDNYFDNMSLCCPARATIMRGQYAHNTGVKSNTMPNGGFEKFHKSGDEKSTIATWIHNVKTKNGKSIYDTALVGKYMNNFPFNFGKGKHNQQYVSDKYVPPGWTDFATPVKGDPYTNNNYKLSIDGYVDHHTRRIKNNPKNYLTDTISNLALGYVRDHQNKPYFLYESFYSPHNPANPAPRYKHFVVPHGPKPEADPAFNQQDMRTMPHWMRKLPPISANVKKQIDENFTKRVRAVQSIDDAVAKMVQELKDTGQYDNTYLIFTSDNGFHEGQHRMAMGKNTPYDTDIHLPLAVVGPGITPHHVTEVVGDQMMAATIAGLTGAKPDYTLDGRSMVPLLYGQHPKDWPKAVLTERFNSQAYSSTADGLNEPADTPAEAGKTSTTPYEGIRTKDFLYVVYNWRRGEKNKGKAQELYDMKQDPYQLHNIAGERHMSPYYHQVKLRLGKELAHLATCKGVSCQH